VCYCFGHTVESIQQEIRETGRSSVVTSIRRKVDAGECSCELLNPKETCCLGDVNKTVKEALASIGVSRPDGRPAGSRSQCQRGKVSMQRKSSERR